MLRMVRTSFLLACMAASVAVNALPSADSVKPVAFSGLGDRFFLTDGARVLAYDLKSGDPRESYLPAAGCTVLSVGATKEMAFWIAKDPESGTCSLTGIQGASVSLDPGWADAKLASICGNPALILGGRARVFNLALGTETKLPAMLAKATGYLTLLPSGLLLETKPYKPSPKGTISMVTAFDVSKTAPKLLGSYPTTAPTYSSIEKSRLDNNGRFANVSFTMSSTGSCWTPGGVAFLEEQEVVRVPFESAHWDAERVQRSPVNGQPLFCLGDEIWVNNQGRVQAASPKTLSAMMPWNGAGSKFLGVVPKGKSAWLITSKGARLLEPGNPLPEDGFGGYVRIPLDLPTLTEKQQSLISELESWFGTPYKWGGNDRNGVDCSGLIQQAYLAQGIRIPRTSAEMRVTKIGRIIKDEIQVGDVLTYPGHVAVYAGVGTTIETVKGGVGRGNIWSRTDVVVRRFLK